ncbi:Phosphoinositide phospholipase C [Dirofilaria immitis]|nr:Phosphoinositide phospholipase C [Dirofilaria immitis]
MEFASMGAELGKEGSICEDGMKSWIMSEKLKEHFYLDDMEIRFLREDELANSQKVVKLERILGRNINPSCSYLMFPLSKSINVYSKANEGVIPKVSSAVNNAYEDAFAIYAKYEKERTELIISLVEQNRKKLIKRLDMAYKCESKQLTRLNHQKRYEEQGSIVRMDGRAKKIKSIKKRRLKEIDDNFELLKRNIEVRMEQRLRKAVSVFHGS